MHFSRFSLLGGWVESPPLVKNLLIPQPNIYSPNKGTFRSFNFGELHTMRF